MSDIPITSQPTDISPFHKGERAVQQRVGVLEQLDARGRLAIRDYMPDQHREFFPQLPFVIVGSIDRRGQPWASVLAGQPGFITSPDAYHLDIRAHALFADPLHDALHADASIGLLGIEPHTRRRNRMNGIVDHLSPDGFSLRVKQSFGNCPKYIQARSPRFMADAAEAATDRIVHRADRLDNAMRRLIGSADTFFIATAFTGDDAEEMHRHGADVSHRGGKPGFVRIDDDETLTVPDFVGNFFFNTLGNILVNAHAGLLFIDFVTGDLLYLAVHAEIIWDGAALRAFEGAQRLLRCRITQALLVEASLPLRWSKAELSPVLVQTGSWEAVAHTLPVAQPPERR